MKKPPTICVHRPVAGHTFLCFLCHEPLHPDDIVHAWTRTVEGPGGSHVEFAHAGCAFAEGFYDEPDPEEERPR